MKTLLAVLLIPFFYHLAASSLDREAIGTRQPRDDLVLDFCLNSASLDAVGNLVAPTGNRPSRRAQEGSVFALLREGQSVSPGSPLSPASPLSPLSVFSLLREGQSVSPWSLDMSVSVSKDSGSPHSQSDEEEIKFSVPVTQALSAKKITTRTSSVKKQPVGQAQVPVQNIGLKYQQPMNYVQSHLDQIPNLLTPTMKHPRVRPVSTAIPFFVIPSHPVPPIHEQSLNNYKAFNLHRFEPNDKPGDFITKLGSLNSLSQAIESLNMFNQNIAYFLISDKYSGRLQVIDLIVNSVYFTIRLNPRILATIIPAIQELIWSYKPFLKGILTIVLDFKITKEGSTMIFVFKEKCLQLANEMRISISELCQPGLLGIWNA